MNAAVPRSMPLKILRRILPLLVVLMNHTYHCGMIRESKIPGKSYLDTKYYVHPNLHNYSKDLTSWDLLIRRTLMGSSLSSPL